MKDTLNRSLNREEREEVEKRRRHGAQQIGENEFVGTGKPREERVFFEPRRGSLTPKQTFPLRERERERKARYRLNRGKKKKKEKRIKRSFGQGQVKTVFRGEGV